MHTNAMHPRPRREANLNIEDRCVIKRLLQRGQSPELVAAAFGVSFYSVRGMYQDVVKQRAAEAHKEQAA